MIPHLDRRCSASWECVEQVSQPTLRPEDQRQRCRFASCHKRWCNEQPLEFNENVGVR